jgi:transcription antitermination protein NusB
MNQTVGDRSTARQFSFQFLMTLNYPHGQELISNFKAGEDNQEQALLAAIEQFKGSFEQREELSPISPEVQTISYEIITGVLSNLEQVDCKIEESLTKRNLQAINSVDLAILRLGVFELRYSSTITPRAVVINEAINLSKKFSSKESGPFINGLLDRVAKQAEESD